MRLLTCEEMKMVEGYTVKLGLSYSKMMENAGSACARYIRSIIEKDNISNPIVAVVCGKGNNGGDGFVVARKLVENGYSCAIIMLGQYPSSKESELMYQLATENSVPIIWYDGNAQKALQLIQNANYIVDAIFGFSFYGYIDETMAPVFDEINNSRGVVFSIDIPSGAYCDSGFADKHCIIADHTIAISALKPAHIIHPSADYCGDIFIANIGIPNDSYNFVRNSIYTLSNNDISVLVPERKENSNKGDFGHLLVIAGSKNMPGACALATSAALKSGVGLVTCAFPENLHLNMSLKLTEALLKPLPEDENGAISVDAIDVIKQDIAKYSAILIGPGLSVTDGTRALVKELISTSTAPLILDADALNIISEDIEVLEKAVAPIILTPHPKEMSRLCSAPVAKIQLERVKFAKDFSSLRNVYLVLKGSNTVVASPKAESVYVNASGNSGLAKGGSGDVLAGILASLVAQNISIPTACATAVYVHGHCGDKAADRLSKMGMTPSDVLDELGRVWREYE